MPAGGTYAVQYINDNNIRWRDVFFWNTCLTVIIICSFQLYGLKIFENYSNTYSNNNTI